MPELRRMFPDIPQALELPPEQQRRFLFNGYRGFVERSARLARCCLLRRRQGLPDSRSLRKGCIVIPPVLFYLLLLAVPRPRRLTAAGNPS
jgi:hypothetical protein